jgi:2-polyprenyl-3-methyl-5-hydroxy-6-metoxy-1,4-benzoquinol methylase
MLTNIQYRILKTIYPGSPECCTGSVCPGKSKLDILFGDEYLSRILGKTIIDFGCGEGVEAVEMAQKGAKRVIGMDIREDMLQTARQKALTADAV